MLQEICQYFLVNFFRYSPNDFFGNLTDCSSLDVSSDKFSFLIAEFVASSLAIR